MLWSVSESLSLKRSGLRTDRSGEGCRGCMSGEGCGETGMCRLDGDETGETICCLTGVESVDAGPAGLVGDSSDDMDMSESEYNTSCIGCLILNLVMVFCWQRTKIIWLINVSAIVTPAVDVGVGFYCSSILCCAGTGVVNYQNDSVISF